MHNLFANLLVSFWFVLMGYLLLKAPKIKKMGVNALCEHSFVILQTKIITCQDPRETMYLEEEIDDFFNEYAGKAIHAEKYTDELYNVLTLMQYA